MVRAWYTPVWEWFLTEAVARGYLSAPGFFTDPLRRKAWCNTEWSGPTMPQVDEEKTVNAARGRLELTLTSYEEETAAMTGTSWTRKFRVSRKSAGCLRGRIPAAQDTVSTRNTVPNPPPPPVEEQ